ncbi:MAG: 50S ribosomal protein L20 [Nitrospinota bacterium]|nr:50S ribosomal protein L20 [Nitrospinota bacterium]
MARVTRGPASRARRKKIMKLAKGYQNARGNTLRHAKEAVVMAMKNNYRDRKLRARNFRALWITRINAAARAHGISYSRLVDGLGKAGVEINRKMLAELAVSEGDAFTRLVEMAKAKAGAPATA